MTSVIETSILLTSSHPLHSASFHSPIEPLPAVFDSARVAHVAHAPLHHNTSPARESLLLLLDTRMTRTNVKRAELSKTLASIDKLSAIEGNFPAFSLRVSSLGPEKSSSNFCVCQPPWGQTRASRCSARENRRGARVPERSQSKAAKDIECEWNLPPPTVYFLSSSSSSRHRSLYHVSAF